MTDKTPPTEISEEELTFIRQLWRSAADELEELSSSSASIDVPAEAPNLLQLLLMAENIHLQADVGNYTLIFEPQTEASPAEGQRRLHLGYPSIVEKNDHSRCHRIKKTEENLYVNEKGRLLAGTHIENISETGMSLVSDAPIPNLVPGKTVLSLELQFPHERRVQCMATVVRATRRGVKPKLALRFIRTPKRTHELLRKYIYNHTPEIVSGH